MGVTKFENLTIGRYAIFAGATRVSKIAFPAISLNNGEVLLVRNINELVHCSLSHYKNIIETLS